jgi:hypothetical protein
MFSIYILFFEEYLGGFVSYIMFHLCYYVYFYPFLRTLSIGYNAIKNKRGVFIFYIFIGWMAAFMYYSHAIYLSRNEWDIYLPGGGGRL